MRASLGVRTCPRPGPPSAAPGKLISPPTREHGALPRLHHRHRGLSVRILVLSALSAVSLALGKSPEIAQTAPWGAGEDAEEERFLLEAEVVESEELGDGITRPLRVTLRLGDRTSRAIFKDVAEEYARADTGSTRHPDTYFSDRWQHEVAAYRLDRLVGLGLVPPTVIRTIRGRTGSLQSWVENAFRERDRVEKGIPLEDAARFREAAARMKVFDALILNVDRNQRNVLIVEPGTRVWLVDHSRAFRLQKRLPIGRKERLPIPAGFEARIAAPEDETIRAALEGLLTKGQIEAILERRKAIAKIAAEGSATSPQSSD